MKPRFMLDTNICIYLMKSQPPQVVERFAKYSVGEVVISSITFAELEYGVVASGPKAKQNREALDAFVEDIHVLPFDVRAATTYGPIRFANRDRKRDALDKLIAAHAISLNLTLVTNNEADFEHINLLKIENWI